MARKATDYIVVHCSATPKSMDIGTYEIDRWHRAKGWLKIGYHYVIRRNGKIEVGRDRDAIGAHVKGYNSRSIGICMVGGVDANNPKRAKNNFTDEQFVVLRSLLDDLKTFYYPDAKIVGHRELNPHKACPSFNVQDWLKES